MYSGVEARSFGCPEHVRGLRRVHRAPRQGLLVRQGSCSTSRTLRRVLRVIKWVIEQHVWTRLDTSKA
eukprot:2303957-Prymnesium_polylepis.1